MPWLRSRLQDISSGDPVARMHMKTKRCAAITQAGRDDQLSNIWRTVGRMSHLSSGMPA